MYWYIVIKHIKCPKCLKVLDVRKFRTTQGADTPEDKALQDRYIESKINSRSTVLGFYICPKCKCKAEIIDPPEPKSIPNIIDLDKTRQLYQLMLKMDSVAPTSQGEYPAFDQFCDYHRACRVQCEYHDRTIKRLLIAGDNFKLDYAFVEHSN